jgi:uncharacterized protein (TIGR00369 family)
MKKKITHSLKAKSPSESIVEMNEMVLPSHTNALGTIFGGVLMSWIDIAAAICAQRHSQRIAVTASVDALAFLAPVHSGDMVNLRAKMVHTGKTSMMIIVEVSAESVRKGTKIHCVTAYLSFVALNNDKKPTAVPPLKLKTAAEKQAFEWAAERKMTLLKQWRSHRSRKP